MLLYLAGELPIEKLERLAKCVERDAGAANFLFTFAYRGTQNCARHFCKQANHRIFIDSGAYTAWSQGKKKKIELDSYIAFCKDIMGIARCPVVFAALDIIAGTKDNPVRAGSGDWEKACEEGWENFQVMKREGIPCLMTYHQGDHARWLTRILDESDYLAVAPRKQNATVADKAAWLKPVFDRAGRSKKIHGLGVASPVLMKTFPFFSVDTTAWLNGGKAHVWQLCLGERIKSLSARDLAKLVSKTEDSIRENKELPYEVPGDPKDKSDVRGTYFFMRYAMQAYVELAYFISLYWENQGVFWERDDSPLDLARNGYDYETFMELLWGNES